MVIRKFLLNENRGALQYLHRAQGFDFEKPHYIGIVSGRFTYKTVTDLIRANIGDDFTAALLIKPSRVYCLNRLHHVTLHGGKFNIECRRDLSLYRFDMDYFHGVGDFENVRKNRTDVAYIIAQKPEYLRTPKNTIPLDGDTRYKIAADEWQGGITRTGDGRGNHWISGISLRPATGSREKVTFQPWARFDPQEKRSNDIGDYIDKSGYVVRFRREDLRRRAKVLRAQKNVERLKLADFSAREEKARADVAAVKRHLIRLIEAAETREDASEIREKVYGFYNLLWDMDGLKSRTFGSPEGKNGYFDGMAERAAKILEEV